MELTAKMDLLHTQAVDKHKQGDLETAIDYYQQALQLNLEQPVWVYGNAITILGTLNRTDEAIDCAQKALQLYEEEDEIYRAIGIALENTDNSVECIKNYYQAIKLNSLQPDWLYCNLVKRLIEQNQLDEAITIAQTAISIYPNFYALHYNLGIALDQTNQWGEAISAYLRAQELKPEFLEIAEKLNLVVYKKNQQEREESAHQTIEVLGLNEIPYSEWEAAENPSNTSVITELKTEAIYLNKKNLLVKLAANIEDDQNLEIYLNGKAITSYLWRSLIDTPANCHLLLISELTVEQSTDIVQLTINAQNNSEYFDLKFTPIKAKNQAEISNFLLPLVTQAYHNVFELIFTAIDQFDSCIALSNLCQTLRENFDGNRLSMEYGCWLTPNILYFEAKIHDCWILNDTKLLVYSGRECKVGKANFFQIAQHHLVGIAVFEQNLDTEAHGAYYLSVYYNQAAVLIEGAISAKAYSLEFIKYLDTKPEHQKHLIRENISSAIIKFVPQHLKSEAGSLLNKLQYFLHISPVNFVDSNLPFKIFIDYIIPIKCDGVFLGGWLHDPYNMLEEIKAISALGFTLHLSSQQIYRLERRDVNEHLRDTRYGNFEGQLGFCAYAVVPTEIRNTVESFAHLHTFRFQVKLKSNIQIEIVPDIKHSDVYTARKKIMQLSDPAKVSESMLEKCIAPAAFKLQQLCIQEVKIKEVTRIGKPVDNPAVSIIIPLYKRLDFMKVQFATMANDPGIKECEIIYVLDSPEQEQDLRNFLLDHCTLYQLPVTLVLMERNSGYAAANNAGASQARGDKLVLLNSDVFAQSPGWVAKMADFYDSSSKIGVLGAKLVYEDRSLQHAGMFFAKTTFPFWISLHYYKGLPGNYQSANVSRAVPAVTGACLMIDRNLFEQVDGLSTDYVIGDFEDSDLCLKCDSLGYESWYFADATLYHLERQSVPLNSVYNGSLAWQLNGRLHSRRWGEQIEKLMDIHRTQL